MHALGRKATRIWPPAPRQPSWRAEASCLCAVRMRSAPHPSRGDAACGFGTWWASLAILPHTAPCGPPPLHDALRLPAPQCARHSAHIVQLSIPQRAIRARIAQRSAPRCAKLCGTPSESPPQ